MITVENLSKVYGAAGSTPAVNDVSFSVASGEICVLIGPSGCGKTTTLRMINRLVTPTAGRVLIDGRDTNAVNTVDLRRSIGYVIQQIGLFPNMTIEQNISVVPSLLGWDAARMRARATELLSMVGLEPGSFLGRFPNQLSGGQQQRVGVCRALAADPPLLLMDEPFGAIDPISRESIQDEFLQMQKKLCKTVLLVSHDIDEAVKLGDKIAIFRGGQVEQFGTPEEVLTSPANDFVAGFVGADRTLKRLRRFRAEQICQPVAIAQGGHIELTVDGTAGTIQVNEHLHVVNSQVGGVAVGWASVAMHMDLRVVASELLALGVAWLPCVDATGRLQGVVSLAGLSRHLAASRAASQPEA
jgi:osmoprotectant transport system ATP-binding protein